MEPGNSPVPDHDVPGNSWTRTWLSRLDEVSASICPSSQASTPLGSSRLVHQRHTEQGSPSQSSSSISDAELAYEETWSGTDEVKWSKDAMTDDPPYVHDMTRSLPIELLLQVMQMLHSRDLVSAMLVSKSWCSAAFPLIWQKPTLTSITQFASFVRVLSLPDPLLPYSTMVRRLVFNGFAKHLTDDLFRGIATCKRLERLTLPGATRLTSKSLIHVLGKLRGLIAIDLMGVIAVDDQVVRQIAQSCPQVQGLNLARCLYLTDDGVMAIATQLKSLRRIKLSGCKAITDRSVVALTRACPLLLELDLASIPQLSNDSTVSIFLNSAGLRELRMNDNEIISSLAIPDLGALSHLEGDAFCEEVGAYPWYLANVRSPKAMANKSLYPPGIDMTLLRPVTTVFDQLRLVDFTSCRSLGDQAIDNLVQNAPQLRSVTLAKCTALTDVAINSLARLGKHLHYLHLGHVYLITDDAVINLARSCTRLRYVDLANCSQLTDASVIALATNLPKLRRIGLVKMVNITDYGISALAEREMTLERLHLSYCDQISLKAVSILINRLPLLTHLSLTGVSAFKTPELQQFCRSAPESYTPHQRASFCVYSGQGVAALRNYLDSVTFDSGSSLGLQRQLSLSSSASFTSNQQDNTHSRPCASEGLDAIQHGQDSLEEGTNGDHDRQWAMGETSSSSGRPSPVDQPAYRRSARAIENMAQQAPSAPRGRSSRPDSDR